MTIDKGIIDSFQNPFIHESWINQGFGFTPKRQEQAEKLFLKNVEDILAQPENAYRYVAFIAVRWGFAKIIDGKLSPTEKWHNRFNYDSHGCPMTKKKAR